MPATFETITKEALDLSPRQRLALAAFLLETTEDSASEPGADEAWEAEIGNRIRAIDQGLTTGVSYAEVIAAAEARLAP